MSDLAKRVRGMANDPNVDFCGPTLNEAADRIEELEEQLFSDIRAETEIERLETRIEALEAALREIAQKRKMDAVAATSMQAIARAALAPEQDKCPSDK